MTGRPLSDAFLAFVEDAAQRPPLRLLPPQDDSWRRRPWAAPWAVSVASDASRDVEEGPANWSRPGAV